VHRDVLQQFLEVLSAGHEVALAIDFEEHADFTPGMNVGAHRAFIGGAGGLLLRGGHAPLAQDHEGFLDVPLSLLQRLQAVAHGRTRFLAEVFYQFGVNLLAHSAHFSLVPFPIVRAVSAIFPQGLKPD
jgi:hypothetical protein